MRQCTTEFDINLVTSVSYVGDKLIISHKEIINEKVINENMDAKEIAEIFHTLNMDEISTFLELMRRITRVNILFEIIKSGKILDHNVNTAITGFKLNIYGKTKSVITGVHNYIFKQFSSLSDDDFVEIIDVVCINDIMLNEMIKYAIVNTK